MKHTKRDTKTGRFERDKSTRMFIQTSQGKVVDRDNVNRRTWDRIWKEEGALKWC